MTHPTECELRSLLAGRLPSESAGSIAAHLEGCVSCRETAEQITTVPRDLWAALVLTAHRELSSVQQLGPPTIPGYEDLHELGRGGCGVVYHAREIATGREVALKLMKAGALASPAEHERFRAEARAAASLRHPYIVAILAVGEVHELPYYAMEFLPDGSLADRLDGTPHDPRTAAAVVEKIAQALQYAHDHGIVHRDLKPGNILLDGRSDVRGLGSPKVSDFGMAKHSRPAEVTTPTQAVLGTPAFMAPEQAFGRSRDVGPTADVYAIGAILYTLLAGRPPFAGGTPYETLLMVRSEEPIPLRKLRPRLQRDLETICLRCLEKDPKRRYPTAAALASDLRAFLAGQPVEARPVGPLTRYVKWGRRNPAVAMLLGLLLTLIATGLIGLTLLWRQADLRGREAQSQAEEASRRLATTREALSLYTQAASKLFRNPGYVSREERDALVRALEIYERLLEESAGDPDEEHRAAYATLQLSDGLRNLGESEAAARVCQRAVGVLRRLSQTQSEQPDIRYDYADGCSQLGGTLAACGNSEDAYTARREAVRVGEELVTRYPNRDRFRAGLAAYRADLGREYAARGNLAEAMDLMHRSLQENRRLVARYPHDPVRYQLFGEASRWTGRLSLLADGRPDRYWSLTQERLELCDRARNQADWPWIVPSLLDPEPACVLVRFGRLAEADRVMTYGLKVWQELASQTPPVTGARATYAWWLTLDGYRRWATDMAGARNQFRRAAALLESNPSHIDHSADWIFLAMILARCPDPSLRDPARALDLARRKARVFGPDRYVLGVCLYEAGEYASARAELEDFLASWRVAPDPADGVADARLYLAMSRWRTVDPTRVVDKLRTEAEAILSDPRSLWSTLHTAERAKALLLDLHRIDP